MKVRLERKPVPEIEFELFQHNNEVHVVEKGNEGWSIVGFRSVNGKLSLFFHTGIEDDARFNLDDDGSISLTEE